MKRFAALLALLPTPALADADIVDDIVLANAEHTLWHEAGHALISEFLLPVIGQEEDAADAFATLMMLSYDDAARIERLLDVAEMWLTYHELAEAEGEPLDFFAEHDLDAQRGLRVICFVAGEGPGRAHELVGSWGLPADRAETCEEDFALSLDSWETLLAPHYRDEGQSQITVRYREGAWKTWLQETELLESVAEILAADYMLEPGLVIRAASCGQANAFWDPTDREITLCYELLDEYRDIAETIVAE